MLPERMQEFIVMLLIENRALKNDNGKFLDFLEERYNLKPFNKRYTELLDEFMNQYALKNAEKSD